MLAAIGNEMEAKSGRAIFQLAAEALTKRAATAPRVFARKPAIAY